MILPSTSQNRGMQDAAKSRGRSFTCFKVRYCSCCEERSIRSKKMKIAGKKNLTRLESTEGNQKKLPNRLQNKCWSNSHFLESFHWLENQCSQPPPAKHGPPFSFNLHLPHENASPRSQIQSLVGA